MLITIKNRMRGVSLTETLIMMPVFLMLTFGALQYALIYEAKSSLDYATFMSARAGAIDHAKKNAITTGLAKSLSPLYSPDVGKADSLLAAIAKARLDVAAFSNIKILNPTKEAFKDFGIKNTEKNVNEIPNEMLHLASTQIGKSSKLNIQDANLLKVQVLYGYQLKVPFVNSVISTVGSWFTRDPIKLAYFSQKRIPILATATVRMQSRAWDNSWITKRTDVEKAVTEAGKPTEPLVLTKIERPWSSGPTGQGNPSGIPGTDTGSGDGQSGNPDNGTDNPPGNNPPTDDTPGDTSGNPGNNPDDPVKCKTKWSDERYKAPEGSSWNPLNWAGNIRAAAATVYDFVEGLVKGLGQQAKDLIDLIKDPSVLWDVANAFVDDPKGTIQALVDAVGADIKKIAECGPGDIGYVIGSNINPAAPLKLLTQIAKLSGSTKLTKYVDDLKKKNGCASFIAGTPIWVPEGKLSIEKLLKGAYVNSRDEKTLINSDQLVTQLHNRMAEGYYRIQTEFGVIEVTSEHPFWVQGKGWVKAKDLVREDPIATINGDVVMYQNEYIEKLVQVYNFTVDKTHNYFAGDMGAWVHNAGIKCIDNTIPSGTKGGKPTGTPETPTKGMPAEQQRGIKRQNEAADAIANEGYKVEYNGDILPNGKNPDLKIEGKYFDVYTPTSSNISQVRKGISKKVKGEQADRIVLNLADSDVSADDISKMLSNPNKEITGLQEVIGIGKDGSVIHIYP